MQNKHYFLFELLGILFIVMIGSSLHFVFNWSGNWRPLAWLAAVNESTWEHLKLSFWPGLLYALLEYHFFKKNISSFWIGKSLGLLFMSLSIILLFYSYKALLRHHLLALDILIFVLAVAAGQLLSYKVGCMKFEAIINNIAFLGLALLIIAFSIFSYFPPRNFLFQDPLTNRYGILYK